ncbi:cell envelope biogenesis protein TolA [uncultured Sphingomonas sp.]|uniref:cell envelope biogenesis protein TolA n=1 Tax=uncultured Sphingomonas sp. TaxID=158754 RepID=UPI0035CB679A
MDRAERIGLGVAIAGHALLFALLSARFFSVPIPTPVQQQPLEVSLVKDVALQAAAPKAVEPPAPSIAPDRGAPEDAAPPEPAEEAQPEPEPKPAPRVATPAPPKPKPAPPKPVEKPAPAPKPVAAAKPAPVKKPRPEPAAAEKAVAKTAPAKPTLARASASSMSSHGKPAATKGTGSEVAAKTSRPRGSLLGDDFLKGLSDKPSKSQSPAPVAAKIDGRALASIQAAIARQIQPCADRQSNGGIPDDAKQVVVTFNLRLNPDGTLAAMPSIVRRQNIEGNERYVQQIADIGIAAFKGCSPLKLPSEYYSTPAGGWNNINYKWQLR